MKLFLVILMLGTIPLLDGEPERAQVDEQAEAIAQEREALRAEIARLKRRLSQLDTKVRIEELDPVEFERNQKEELLVHLDPGGGVIVGGEKLSREELMKKLKAMVEVNEDQPVRIGGDHTTTYVDLMGLIEVCQKAGVWNISFVKKKEDAPAEEDAPDAEGGPEGEGK